MTELKSLKNPTRILTAIMFLAFIVYSIGAQSLAQILPFVPEAGITCIVGVATYLVTQYGTEKRIVRAEELKDQEYSDKEASEENVPEDESLLEEETLEDKEELMGDGV